MGLTKIVIIMANSNLARTLTVLAPTIGIAINKAPIRKKGQIYWPINACNCASLRTTASTITSAYQQWNIIKQTIKKRHKFHHQPRPGDHNGNKHNDQPRQETQGL